MTLARLSPFPYPHYPSPSQRKLTQVTAHRSLRVAYFINEQLDLRLSSIDGAGKAFKQCPDIACRLCGLSATSPHRLQTTYWLNSAYLFFRTVSIVSPQNGQ
jgi:hypothetical protein